MDNHVPFNKITLHQPDGSRKKARPKLRCLDPVLENFKTLKLTHSITSHRKTHKELQGQKIRLLLHSSPHV